MRLLLVTHEEETRLLAAGALGEAGHVVTTAGDEAEAAPHLDAGATDVAVVDVGLPHRAAWTVLARLAAASPPPPAVVLVARSDHRALAQTIRQGAAASVLKPFLGEDLVAACAAALERGRRVPPPQERRQDARWIVVTEVTVTSADGAPLGPGELADLGTGGAQVRLPVRLAAGARVRLTPPVPMGSPLVVDAIVQWSGPASSGFAHGLQFVDLTLSERRQLRDLLDRAID